MPHSRIVSFHRFGAWAGLLALVSGLLVATSAAPAAHAAPLDPDGRAVEFPAGGSNPVDVAAGLDGSVWVALFNDKKIVRLDQSGSIVNSASLPGGPSVLVGDGVGGVWAAELAGNAIDHVSNGEDGTTRQAHYPIPTPGSSPSSIYAVGKYVYFTESAVGLLGRLDTSTGTITELTLPFMSSASLVTGDGSAVWVTGSEGDTWIVDLDGVNPIHVGERGRFDVFAGAHDISLLPQPTGRLLVLATWQDKIELYSWAAGEVQSWGVPTSAQTQISGAARATNRVWFVDSSTNTVEWSESDGVAAEYRVPTANSGLSGFIIGSDRGYGWSAERRSGKVLRFDLTRPEVDRIGGADRFEVAANLSKSRGSGLSVFLASGEVFADALSAAPIAAENSAPILLTRRSTLPDPTRDELMRYAPHDIYAVGGPASISDDVLRAASEAAGGATVTRIDGSDRYAVSRALLTGKLGSRVVAKVLYVANGRNFPDALSSTAAAAFLGAGILLVDGLSESLSAEEMAIIAKYSASDEAVKIVGGPNSVSAGIEAQIAGVTTVERLGGADRFEVSRAVVNDAFAGAGRSHAFIASGLTFPDALAGGTAAGRENMPLLLARTDCIPAPSRGVYFPEGVQHVTLLGGPNTLSPMIEKLPVCG